MRNKEGFHYMRGEAWFAKVLGDPVWNYERNGKEWTLEMKPDEDGLALLEELEVADRINKGPDKDRILFRQREFQANGKKNRPITVTDAEDHLWPQDVLIGNKSIIDFKFKYVDNGKGRKASLFPQGIRVLEHIPYVRQEFAPLNEEDKFFRREVNEFEENDEE
jgi:hypothetical protein